MSTDYILLIDGDNVNCSYLFPFMKYIESHFGPIAETHLFGKLKSSYLDDWKAASDNVPDINTHVTENYKNSTDIQMVLVAFQKYFSENQRHFVILSSDSDMISVSAGLPSDAEVIIGYSARKASAKYLADLDSRGIKRIDIDSVRGELTDSELRSIVNKVIKTYISFKLSDKFFSYATVQEWLTDRYPDIDSLTAKNIYKYCDNLTLQFNAAGVSVKSD